MGLGRVGSRTADADLYQCPSGSAAYENESSLRRLIMRYALSRTMWVK
jgi:hypothetical protein